MTEESNDDVFADGVARPLRARERASADFEQRVMSAVRAVAREARDEPAAHDIHWVVRPRTMRVTPLRAFALAASFAAVVALGTLTIAGNVRAARVNERLAAQTDTVHLVRFVFVDSTARSVALVGAFNQWQRGITRLRRSPVAGVWIVDVPLVPGRHEYAFVVNDGHVDRWVADPLSQSVRDDFGVESSVITLGVSASS